MKRIVVTFKDPDALDEMKYDLEREIQAEMSDATIEARSLELEKRFEEVCAIANPFLEGGEYLRVEIDRNTRTLIVLRSRIPG